MRRLKQKRTYEVALSKAGLGPVAGVDEAGRGAQLLGIIKAL